MSADTKRYVTNSLPEFLLLASLEPRDVFADDFGDGLQSVVVCYDAQNFYKNYRCVFENGTAAAATAATEPASVDEFVAYCDSKIRARYAVVDRVQYRCCMTVSDLMRMDAWARLYDRVGPRVTKYLLFNCLLFVPVQRDVYYCVHTPSQQAGRYEVLRSFRARAGARWTAVKKKEGRGAKTKPATCFNIAGLLKGGAAKMGFWADAADEMLRDILRTDVGGGGDENWTADDGRLDVLRGKLKVMAGKDSSWRAYKGVYEAAAKGVPAPAEIPLRRIKEFAVAVVRKIVPRELFGVNGNRDQYCENLCRILNCGVLHDFTVQQIVHKIKAKKLKWLDRVDADRRTRVMTKTLVWLTNAFVFRRIAHFFRIVATNTPYNGVAYFTKARWATMCHEKISPLMRGGEFFRELRRSADDDDDGGGSTGPTTSSYYRDWKVCPYAKPNGVRLIFKLRQKESSVDKQLTDHALTFLRCLSRTYSAEFRSVSRPQFFRGWNASQRFRNGRLPVYYVRTDFRDAFTSFEHAKLQAVVRDRIQQHFGKGSAMLYVNTVDVVKVGSVVQCKKRKYFDGLPVPEFPGGSLVFYDETTAVPLSRIWDVVQRCVRRNAVELNGRRWAMIRGIVQGDRLSVALCDLLLADLQATRLNDMVGGSHQAAGRLYRFVDDYVFVSSDRTAARRFLDAMRTGFAEYGLQLNRSKTDTNLDGGGDGLVKFLGFRLNAVTGEVTKDETAYRNRRPLHFFDCNLGRGRPGRALYAKMTGPNRHPVSPALISRSLNSTGTVARNVASVVAYKAHAAVAAVRQYFFHLNPAYLLNTVHAVARLMYAKACGLTRHSAVTPMQCKWIVYEVYARVLRRRFPARDGHRAACAVVDRIRDRQSAIGRKCNTRVLKIALRRTRYDFTKMFG